MQNGRWQEISVGGDLKAEFGSYHGGNNHQGTRKNDTKITELREGHLGFICA